MAVNKLNKLRLSMALMAYQATPDDVRIFMLGLKFIAAMVPEI